MSEEKHPYTDLTDCEIREETKIGYQEIRIGERWWADFYPLEKRGYWQKLDSVDSGRKNGDWSNTWYQTYLDNRNLIEIVADNFELIESQSSFAEAVFTNLDLRRFGIRKEKVAAVLCAYIIHTDVYDYRECHPNTSEQKRPDNFSETLREYGVKPAEFAKLYGRVESTIRRNGRLMKSESARGVYKPSGILLGEERTPRAKAGSWFPAEQIC